MATIFLSCVCDVEIALIVLLRTLAALRDALLPKLLRGEVRVTVHE